MTGTLFLVRHGSTPFNDPANVRVRPAFPSRNEPRLTRKGRAEIREAADNLENAGIRRVTSDDVARTREAGDIVANNTGARRQIDKRLRTWNMGALAGQPEEDVEGVIDSLMANPEQPAPGGGESFGAFSARTNEAVADALKRVAQSGESECLALHAKSFAAFGIPEPEPGAVFAVTIE